MQTPVTTPPANTHKHTLSSEILRSYDIRGIYGQTLTETDAEAIGRAFSVMLDQHNLSGAVCIGYDGRHSSPSLAQSVSQGLMQAGRDVIQIECGPTPMCYYAMHHLDCAGSIMITGSHNPPEYNGLKLSLKTGPVYGDMIQSLGMFSENGIICDNSGSHRDIAVETDYISFLSNLWPSEATFKIAWDAGNGAAGHVIEKLTASLSGTHHLLYTDIDGDFPNHHPDPQKPKNLVDIIAKVKQGSCDFGLAFDGDGDRVGVIDDQGEILPPDHLLALLAQDVLNQNPGATIIGDVKCSESAYQRIRQLGGTPLAWACGHSLIKTKMKETGAALGGELSGHVFFAENHNFDDALFAALKLVQLIAQTGTPLSQLRKDIKTLSSTPEWRFAIAETDKFPAIVRLKTLLKADKDAQVSTIDGVRVTTPTGWWLVRASNTEAALSMRIESDTPQALKDLKQQVRSILVTAQIPLPSALETL